MKKPAVIFTILSVYIVAAFAWWTYAHLKSNKENYEQKMTSLELLPYKASLDLRGAVDQEMFRDTISLKEYFSFNYPQLTIYFDTEYDPMFNYMIIPSEQAVVAIEKQYKRRIWMYSLEGIVMVILLFWGIIWIYRSLQSRLNLKKQQSNFLLSITHELKTPLASIKLYLETLLRRTNLDKSQSEMMLKNSLSDVTRLRDLVDNLLMAAQLDNHRFNLTFTPVDLSLMVQETVNRYIHPRSLQERTIVHIEPGAMANIDTIAMEMVITNLLSNAFKYSPKDSPVKISLHTEGQSIRIRVADEGPGISDEDKKNLFDKFYRAEDENVRKSKGTGLGLFIVKNLLNLHAASISVNDNTPHGVLFEINIHKYVA